MAAPPVDDTNRGVAGLDRTPEKLLNGLHGLLFAQTVQVQVSLDGETTGSKVVEIQPPGWVYDVLDIFATVFDRYVSASAKLLEHLQRLGFIIVRLNFEWGGKSQGDLFPPARAHIRHCSFEQFPVGQVRRLT